jgi:polygalacturonase
MKRNLKLLVILTALFVSFSAQAQMPTPVFDVTSYGAVGNGTTKNTAAIQAAIDACTGTGGTVYLHDGIFLSGMLKLKSNMTFYIAPTATILGSTDILDYPTQVIPTNNWNKQENGRGFLYSLGAKNLTITGGGTINGNGSYGPWTGFVIDELERPIPVWLVQSNKVEFSNLTVKDGAMWNVVPFETDSLIIRNITINSNIAANRDGIDIVDCHHVLIEGCKIYVDDDAICPKSGHVRGVQDLIVRNCEIQKSGRASGIKCGTLGYGSFKDMLFEDITINDVNLAGIALESVDGANIENVIFRRIKMTNVASPFFIILGDRGRTPDGSVHKIGTVKNILFQDITASKITQNIGCPISGLKKNGITYKVKNITFDNVKVDFTGGSLTVPGIPGEYAGQYPEVNMWGNVPAYGFYLNHADSVVFKNCNFTVSPQDARPLIAAQDTSRVIVQNSTSDTIKIDNIIVNENHISDSEFSNTAYLRGVLTNNGSNDSKATGTTEAWVEFEVEQPKD